MARLGPALVIHASARAAVVVTPQMRLALDLLSLPQAELAARLEREMESNPALELEEEEPGGGGAGEGAAGPPGDAAEVAIGRGDEGDAGLGAGNREVEELPPESAAEDPSFAGAEDSAAAEAGGWIDDAGRWPPERELPGESAREPARFDPAHAPTLAETLRAQLAGRAASEAVRRAAEYLIDCLDERGRLLCPIEDAERDLGLPPPCVEAGLRLVQSLDPPGIGARDLRECLRLQLAARRRQGSPAWRLLDEAWDLLAARRLSAAARRLRFSPERLASGLEEIRRLVPHPGRLVAGGGVRYILPDVLVQRVGTELLVCPEDRALPPLRLSRSCSRLLAAGGGDAAAREFATRKVREARSLLRALDRRRGTLVRVMECIVGEQSEFFERGTAFLQPMTLKTVASRLGLHESTVARVVRGKYADTPLGLFPLRHFFSGGFRGGRGPGASGRAVRARIRGLIEAEDPRRPLTDEELVGILETEGLAIARRTVTKYRNNLGIEQARLRRHRLRRASGRGAAGSPA